MVHHSSEFYNLSTALRQTSSGWIFGWIFYLPMALAGVPPIVMGAVALIDLLYQYWVHTEMVGRLGWMDRVFVTPSNHRVHHGQNDYCIDRNYGGILILWDRLFGTFADERDDEKSSTACARRCAASIRCGPTCTTTPTCGAPPAKPGAAQETASLAGSSRRLDRRTAGPFRRQPIRTLSPGHAGAGAAYGVLHSRCWRRA
jgi:hypothetical protein